MSQQTSIEQNEETVSTKPLDAQFIQQISSKSIQLDSILVKLSSQLKNNFGPNVKTMAENTKKMMDIISKNLDYLNNTEVFNQDFNKSIHGIDVAYDSYIKAASCISDSNKNSKLVNQVRISIDNFAQSINIYSSVIEEILNDKAQNPEGIDLLNTRLGLESALYNFAVNVEPTTDSPYFKSRFVEIYKCYKDINNIQNNIAAIKSVCGTGKTLCLPIILLNRVLKDKMNAPFLLITQPSPKHVEYKENFFNKTISKYVTIISDPDKLEQMYNEYEKTQKIDKMVLAVLTPHNLLPLMYALRRNKQFYPRTRIIVDEIHQRTFHLDVLITKISDFDRTMKLFTLPLGVILMSATISPSLLKPFNGKVKVTTLIKYPQFEIIEKPPIIESDIQKINNEIMRDQTVMVIDDMAKINSNIEEGHILCFLSGIGICSKLKNAVISSFKHSEETETKRKVVFLQTTLKPNETTESYFRRLREEYLLNEGLKEGKNYKNDFLYFVPLVLSGLVDDAIYELSQNEFPGDLKKINKLICSTPMIESSFTIDHLSVVVDSGLYKETEFDLNTSLTTLTEKQTSRESMEQRKGRLGRTMKGLYVSIHAPNNKVPDIQTPPIQRLDLSTNVLLMKDICINFESMNNLPTPPNRQNLDFALDTLIYIGAIDQKTLKITPFGHELLNYPFISIYYAAAIINFRETFPGPEKMFANFIAAYISTVVTMDTILVQEDMTEKMSRFFKADSDITTLVNPLNSLLIKSESTENDELRDLVESYGFSYSQFLVFKTHMQEIVDLTFPGKTISNVLGNIGGFVKSHGGITGLVDIFIPQIEKVFPNWKEIHTIYYKHVTGVGGFESRPTIVFNGDEYLKFPDQRQRYAEVRISRRPGWNGIMIPTECYCFNITRNSNAKLNYGRLIHRMNNYDGSCAISSVECDKIALNPWFDVLLDTYFKDSNLDVTYFSNIVKTNNNNNNSRQGNRPVFEYRMFHFSNAGERVFISFIPNDPVVKNIIVQGINKCLQLMPFTPRSLLVFKSDIQSVVEITSIGAQHYESSLSSNIRGSILDKKTIDYCLKHIDELAKSNSTIRICALFIKETCKLNEYDRKHLYFINTNYDSHTTLKYLAQQRSKEMLNSFYLEQQSQRYLNINNYNQLELFQFPTKFIHPALLYHQESLDCIMKWFKVHCRYANVVKVIGHRLLMKQGEIIELQKHLRLEKEKIQKEMNLKFSIIPVPSHIYAKAYLEIKQHPTWDYNNRFKVIIVSSDEASDVNEFLNRIRSEIEKEKTSQNQTQNELSESTLCCLYICEDPDNPVLTNYPLTIYYKDGTTYTNKMCRDCLADTLRVATESYFVDGKIDQTALESIIMKPSVIPTVESTETKDGLECWPQVPLGQIISALIVNDDELSSLVSAWLEGVCEFTIRNLCRDKFTFCPNHPHRLFDINEFANKLLKCNVDGCNNVKCPYCNGWHDKDYICDEKKSGKLFVWKTVCPKCKAPTFKDGGCNHITCICGCHWCYKCGEGFTTANKCYEHLFVVHGGCFDYHFDD